MASQTSIWFLTAIAARTLIVLLFLVLGVRLLARRQIGQMNIYDLALILALANSVQNAMTQGSGHLAVGIVSAGALLSAGRVLGSWFVKWPKLEEHLVGTPTLVVNEGHLVPENMRRIHVTEEQVRAALRQHGLTDPGQVKMAILEVDGTLSVVPQDAPAKRTRQHFRTLRRP